MFLYGRLLAFFRLRRFESFELEVLLVLHVDFDDVLALEFASQHRLRQRVFYVVFDGSSQGSCAEFGVVALLDDEFLGPVGQFEL